MKHLIQKVMLLLWICVATIGITKYWYIEPDSFPWLFKSIANRIIELSGTQGAEQVANLELLFVIISALLVALGTTWLLALTVKLAANQINSRPSV